MENLKIKIKDFFKVETPIYFYSALLGLLVVTLMQPFNYKGDILSYTITNPKRLIDSTFTGCYMCNDSIEELYIDFVLFNKGNGYLDFSRILNEGIIQISASDSITNFEILNFIKTRKELPIETVPIKNGVGLKFVGDEALEKLDGILLSIKYLGKPKTSWKVNSRVKGYVNGIKEIKPQMLLDQEILNPSLYLTILLFFMGLVLFTIYRITNKEEIFNRNLYLFGGILAIVASSYWVLKDDIFMHRKPKIMDNKAIVKQTKYYPKCLRDNFILNDIKNRIEKKGGNICNNN